MLLQQPLLSDFGVSELIPGDSSPCIAPGPIGTPLYMAPEMLIRGRSGQDFNPVSKKADVWSTGIMFVEAALNDQVIVNKVAQLVRDWDGSSTLDRDRMQESVNSIVQEALLEKHVAEEVAQIIIQMLSIDATTRISAGYACMLLEGKRVSVCASLVTNIVLQIVSSLMFSSDSSHLYMCSKLFCIVKDSN